jgi:hypothetical protein
MLTKTILFIAIVAVLAFSSFAAAPPNDNIANAIVLKGNSGNINSTTAEASTEGTEPGHFFKAWVYKTVWFSFTAQSSGPVSFEVTSANGFDAAIAAYEGNVYATMIRRAFNNDTIGQRPRIELMTQAGTTYSIVVGVFNNSNASGGTFELSWNAAATPSNDNFANALNIEGTSGSVAITNQNATVEGGEPSRIRNGVRSVWLNYTNTTGHDHSVTFDTRLTGNPSFDTVLSVYTGNSFANLTRVVQNDNGGATLKARAIFLAKAGTTYRIAVDGIGGVDAGNILLRWQISIPGTNTSFALRDEISQEVTYPEGTDITVFRPSTGTWYFINSLNFSFNTAPFGLPGDVPVAGDYDGDGRADLAVIRDQGGFRTWYFQTSYDHNYYWMEWGLTGDKAVPADYDNDGRLDIAVFRPSNSTWYIIQSSDGHFVERQWGLNGDLPVTGDFAGTTKGTDIAVFRPSNGTWYIADGAAILTIPFGLNGDIPVPVDYDFDGITDIAVYRPSDGTWHRVHSGSEAYYVDQWGLPGDIPQPGDYDSNSNDTAELTVFRPGDQTWYLNNWEATEFNTQPFGLPGDIPASSLVPYNY